MRTNKQRTIPLLSLALPVLLWGCGGSGGGSSSSSSSSGGIVFASSAPAESCMNCHNQSQHDDYAGPGLENPHPFPGAATLKCTTCHGGDPTATIASLAHVPPPPEIGDKARRANNNFAYFNRLTLTGIDKFPDYTYNGRQYTAIDYLQFINPGDLRVVTQGRSCGGCHSQHCDSVSKSLLATEAGILSGAMFAIGVENHIPAHRGLYADTAADLAFRAVVDTGFATSPAVLGAVEQLLEFPVYSRRNSTDPGDIFRNNAFDSPSLPAGQNADGTVIAGSPLAKLYHEQIAFTCGDCHLGSAGANNRYGDFRSSGCTACHMRYALDGRDNSTDPNINKIEPLDPDDIEAPERPHVRRHLITSIAQTLVTGETVQGMDDYTCAGCHQGSNRTVMQFWGIRLDQNQDLRRRVQYPANPASYQNTALDTRLFDPTVNNRTFNGRNPHQYILTEDYDDDGRDDTPPDVHYEAGMGCIDCHGSHDLHGGEVGNQNDARILSRQEQGVAIRCESCHGTVDAYATTAEGRTYDGQVTQLAVDREGNVLRHVRVDENGNYILKSRLTGREHYISQTRDVVVDNGRRNPFTNELVYSEKASYAMGRADGDPSTGLGPQQAGGVSAGFSHSDNMSCVSCHASWTNSCIGCHLGGEYDEGGNFSNITGERIVFRQANADFVYQSPVPFQLGIDSHGKISPMAANTEVFFQYRDLLDQDSQIFTFSDRNGGGSNNTAPRNTHPSLSHNALMPHSIRGKVDTDFEGPRYCVSCHLTTEALANYGPEYDTFRDALANDNYANLDFPLLQTEIGENTGNQRNSPFFVHMAAGLGTGLFLMDENGCPVNPLDDNDNRFGCEGTSPADRFDPATFQNNVAFDLDRMVEESGVSNGSNNHQLLSGTDSPLRDGALDRDMSGPLGADLIRKLADPVNGIILDSWLDANGDVQGSAGTYITP